MTIPVSDRLSQLYVGNDINTRFDFTFRVFKQEDTTGIAVRIKKTVEFETLDPALYTVTLNQDQLGGYVTFNSAPKPNTYFYIAGATPLDQLLDITNYDNFYPDAIERALDKLTALLQEWSVTLDQEKQARILADLHYDSLAMEREENLEARLTSYINAMIGMTNPAVFEGITDRMVITKDGRTQREFNESIPFWTNDYVNFKQATYLREEQILDHVTLEDIKLSQKVSDETSRAMGAEHQLQEQINSNGIGNRAYKTYADMVADKVNIPAKSKVTVTNDSDATKNGDYQYDGTNFTKSAFDPVQQAQDFANANKYFKPVIFDLTSDLNNFTTGGVWFAPTSGYAALERNFPIVSGGWLTVIDSSNNQKYQRYDTHEFSFLRRLSSGVWSPWVTQDMTKAVNTASNYTDYKAGNLAGYDQANLLAGATIIADKYLHTSGVITDQAATMYAVIPVVVGSYFFKNYGANIVAGSFPVGFSPSANATNYTILTRNFVETGVYRVDVTEVGYLAFDLKLNNYNFISTLHVASSYAAVNKNAVKINGADVADPKLRISAFTGDNSESIGNLYNKLTNKPDVYVHVNTANIASATGAILTQIKVKKGATYHIKAPDLRGGIFAVALRDNSGMGIGPTLGLAMLTQITATYKTFTVPVDSLAEYALLTVKLPSLNLDIENTISITTNPASNTSKKINKLNGASIAAATLNKLTAKVWTVIGDSITELNFRASKNYHDFISEDVGGMTIYNRGVSGSGFWNRLNVADTITEQPDIITLFWGVNDFGKNFPMGDFLSTDTNTLSGRMNYVISSLINKFPLAKIAILTPLPTKTQWGSNATPNEQGFTLKDICDMEVRYAKHFSLPVLNQYETSNLPAWVQAANEYYFTADDGLHPPDGLHPNAAGQRVMADKIKPFLESI